MNCREATEWPPLADFAIPIRTDLLGTGTAAWERDPVIMLSGHSDQSFIDQALSMGADEYIVKPFQRNELIQCMRRLASRPSAV